MKKFARISVFLSAIVLIFMFLDFMLAKRAKEIISDVQSRKTEKIIIFNDQPGDICNALTGGIWLKPVMIFTNKLEMLPNCKVSVTGGYCSRAKKHQIVFTCK
ncbi:hypothetical protein KA996_10730 [bacterium]|nr:hypothetical protein [bacterium]